LALKLSVTTPEGLVHQGEARKVIVPALDGELGILSRHAPLIAMLGVGELRVTPAAGGESYFFIAGGFLQVLKDRVVVLATRAEPQAAIDRAQAEDELRQLRADAVPPRSSIPAREARSEKIRAARARLKVATRRMGDGRGLNS